MPSLDRMFTTVAALAAAVRGGASVRPIATHPREAIPQTGEIVIEMPHYPAPHRWYARVELVAGRVRRVRSL